MSRPHVTIEWIEGPARIQELEREWVELEPRVPGRTVFGSFDYLVTWYRYYGPMLGRPMLGVARRGGTLVGLAPLHLWWGHVGRVPVRRLDLAGHNCEVGEFLFDPDDSEVGDALLRDAFSLRGVDVCAWNGFEPGSELGRHVERAARAARRSVESARYYCARVDLAGGYDGYARAMSGSFRRTVRRMEARVGEAGGAEVVRLHAPSEPAEVWPLLERMFAISNASWKARAGGPLAPHHRRFYEDLAVRFARRGMLDLTIASIGGEDAAFVFALAEQGVFYDGNISFVDRFRDLSPGAWLMQRVLRDLPASGIHTVISHGDHAYKLRWASGFVPLDRLFLFARTPLGTMARMSRFHLPGPLRRRLTPVSELGRALGR